MNSSTKKILTLFLVSTVAIVFNACSKNKNDFKNTNPDPDEDGVCDSWVSENGLSKEYAEVCVGIDKCPNEAGDGTDGCPVSESDFPQEEKLPQGVENRNPNTDGDGLCDPWVSQENKLAQFIDQCKGYDNCPDEAGAKANKGCPWDDPDADNDGICDSWVIEVRLVYYFENAANDKEMAKEWYITKFCKGPDKS